LQADRQRLVDAISTIDMLLDWVKEQEAMRRNDKPVYDWTAARLLHEAGAGTKEITMALGCSASAVKHRRKLDKWVKKVEHYDAAAVMAIRRDLANKEIPPLTPR